jgi:cell wall-associated protease
MRYFKFVSTSLVVFLFLSTSAQDFKGEALQTGKSWFLGDKTTDGFYGISLQKAQRFVKSKKPSTVLVAVIDAGVNINHKDLKNFIWTNPDEIAGNGIDDDGNGYVDDIHGWNFLGGKHGETVTSDSYAQERLYFKYKRQFENLKDAGLLNPDSVLTYQCWKEAEAIFQRDLSAKKTLLKNYLQMIVADEILRSKFNIDTYSYDYVKSIIPRDSLIAWAKWALLQQGISIFYDHNNLELLHRSMSVCSALFNELKKAEQPPKDSRGDIVADNYDDIKDRYYGNKSVGLNDPSTSHGTHVTGIIKSVNSADGIGGVSCAVQLMILRAVPAAGDEHDKDIALAIRYAVDNGARIINMSFGKCCSSEKKWVDQAVRYAEEHDVLIVHAAGNQGINLDSVNIYPNPYYDNNLLHRASNWINVGASGRKLDDLVPAWSNYGKKKVDVFAPGVSISSCFYTDDKFVEQSGTSMAAPVVSGVAAFIWSYFPGLSCSEIKYVIEHSAERYNHQIQFPGSRGKAPFTSLSLSGGIVNAYNAVRLADKLLNNRKNNNNNNK